jgi:hypothetical protein
MYFDIPHNDDFWIINNICFAVYWFAEKSTLVLPIQCSLMFESTRKNYKCIPISDDDRVGFGC